MVDTLRHKNIELVIEVEFDYRVEEIFLQQLKYATQAKNTGGFLYEVTFNTSIDMRPAIFDFAHDNGLKILRLNKKT